MVGHNIAVSSQMISRQEKTAKGSSLDALKLPLLMSLLQLLLEGNCLVRFSARKQQIQMRSGAYGDLF